MKVDEGVLAIDCEECPYNWYLSSPSTSKRCANCKLFKEKEFSLLQLKSKYFIKEYNKKLQLQMITPFYMDVRFANITEDVKLVDQYMLPTGAAVQVFKRIKSVGYIYSLIIPEMNVSFKDLEDLYEEIEEFKRTARTTNPTVKRWFVNYGILEHFLRDNKILEININPPPDTTAIRIVHEDWDECITNIYPSNEFLEYVATRMKIDTGRPLNKAQPQLDGEIIIGEIRGRVAALVDPFSVFGTGYSIRKHRERPWTLPLFIRNKAINPWFAGLLSLAISHGRTFLTAGPRRSGKTSLLGALLLEILPKYRLITIEDTQELPITAYKNLGYDILPLKVRSALLKEGMEIPFDIGLRTGLRLGDSCLIIGEIRSMEAKVLYEAMRVGAMSNVVAGTIHSDSPYGVFDRVVNDLGVPRGSFKVTDLIIIVNQIKNPTGLSRVRGVLSVTEVLKDWEDTPVFQDLLVYDPKKDELVPTRAFLDGKSVLLKQILERTKGYARYSDLLDDIQLRAWAKDLLLKRATDKMMLEAEVVQRVNVLYTNLATRLEPLASDAKKRKFMETFDKRLQELLENAAK
jgi:type IV secretory pathway ATPase VirB11/archaellum biosynthesis ATPase